MDVESIRDEVMVLLDDQSGAIWSAVNIETWIYDGEMAIAALRPDATSITVVDVLVAGTLQTIPSNGLQFVEVPRNVTAGDDPGVAVTRTDRGELDRYEPGWHMLAEVDTIIHFLFDPVSPREFYTYPPVIAGTKASVCYSVKPVAYGVVDEFTEITVSDNFRPALIEWALHRARTVDIKANQGIARNTHLANFYQLLGVKSSAAQ